MAVIREPLSRSKDSIVPGVDIEEFNIVGMIASFIFCKREAPTLGLIKIENALFALGPDKARNGSTLAGHGEGDGSEIVLGGNRH